MKYLTWKTAVISSLHQVDEFSQREQHLLEVPKRVPLALVQQQT